LFAWEFEQALVRIKAATSAKQGQLDPKVVIRISPSRFSGLHPRSQHYSLTGGIAPNREHETLGCPPDPSAEETAHTTKRQREALCT